MASTYFHRLARRVIESGEKVSKSKLAADILGATRINLFGLGLTIFGLQSTVGGLVGKALTSSSTGAYNLQAAQAAPAAIDVFAVQVRSIKVADPFSSSITSTDVCISKA